VATYNELYGLYSNATLRNLVQAAVTMKAYNILQEATPSQARKDWAKTALQSGQAEADYLLRYVLCANAALTVAQILAATDAAVLTAVGAAVDKLYP
jgi:hypothetical protein